MLSRKKYIEELNLEMDMYRELMKTAWGEVPILEPKVEIVLKVRMDFDLGDFPHQGQSFIVEPGRETKMAPAKIAKRIVQEVNSHRNHCNRCGVPVPHIWSRQYGQGGRLIGQKNWRTGGLYTAEDLMLYDIPPDELERKLHPMISGRVDKRLRLKAEAEKNSTEEVDYKKEMDDWFGGVDKTSPN
jgi:hypothetical protein